MSKDEETHIRIVHTPYERGCRKNLGMSQISNTFKITAETTKKEQLRYQDRQIFGGKNEERNDK